jgi:hypothetical protein
MAVDEYFLHLHMIIPRHIVRSITLLVNILWILPRPMYAQLEQLYVRQVDNIDTSIDLAAQPAALVPWKTPAFRNNCYF